MKRFIKYSVPTKYDHASFATIWEHHTDNHKPDLYIQLARDDENPRWERISFLLETAFENMLDDPEFMEDILRLFEEREDASTEND